MNKDKVIEKMRLGYQVVYSTHKQEYSLSRNGADRTVIDKETYDEVIQDPRVYSTDNKFFIFNEMFPILKMNGTFSDDVVVAIINQIKTDPLSNQEMEWIKMWCNANPELAKIMVSKINC